MCGICGKLYFDPSRQVNPWKVDRMMDAIAHRGPDGRGKYVAGPVGLGHTRLAIIDLGTGDQPMTNEDKTVWLVYNGEVYNFHELREELIGKGHTFRSNSDTEVIVHLYEEYGPECASRLRGMFAFALWDNAAKTLFLARDRVGIKPLYYINTGNALLFASEIKALLRDPDVPREVDLQSIHRFLTFLHNPGDQTLLKGVRKLEPGHYLIAKDGRVNCCRYWDLQFRPATGNRSLRQTCDDLRELMKSTVRQHLISDVPLGVLLSGGVDSTVVLACAAEATSKPVSTFTIGFEGEEFDDERPFARLAAARYGADHHELTVSAQEFSGFLPAYVRHMEEPVCEAPAIALHYVAKLARQHVTVVLSGEGGDEAFAGYQTYRNLLLLERLKGVAGPFQGLLGPSLDWLGALGAFGKVRKYAPICELPLERYYYSRVGTPFSYFNRHRAELCTPDFYGSADDAGSARIIEDLFARVDRQATPQAVLNRMLYVDTNTWLPNDLLIKADKITMANSLELRVPLLDHVVLEFAAGLPTHFKVKGWTTKRILKQAFKDDIPREVVTRRKAGFPVPLRRWLRNDLGDLVREVLLGETSVRRGYFDRRVVEQLLERNSRDGGLMKEVFSLLTLELWHREFMDVQPASQAAESTARIIPYPHPTAGAVTPQGADGATAALA
ncbi:MAG: asparagine synthase (glutamine-hydrolyzing) [Verrucomicrobia bacterium]|nr:asparagine synthase (glutamine-hydrolyzing) [Verrucomicrobiota bacterium]